MHCTVIVILNSKHIELHQTINKYRQFKIHKYYYVPSKTTTSGTLLLQIPNSSNIIERKKNDVLLNVVILVPFTYYGDFRSTFYFQLIFKHAIINTYPKSFPAFFEL